MALPAHLDLQRTHVVCEGEVNYHTSTATSANIYASLGADNSWSTEAFRDTFKAAVKWLKGSNMEFDLIGIDPAIANALRRILIAELPTMAIEHVFFLNNTSIITCEVLAHRLGLIPLNINPDLFDFKAGEEAASEKNTAVFKLKVECKRLPDSILNEKVYSNALQWLPEGSEMPDETNCRFAGGQASTLEPPAGPVHDDILLAKMRPGQVIDLEAHATKGVGAEHAKWSPVATAWYRLQPEVVLTQQIAGSRAEELEKLCPGLFKLESKGGKKVAKVTSARGDEQQLEKLRHLISEEPWKGSVRLQKRKEHVIFTIESVGVQPPELLFTRALDTLSNKCDKLLALL